MMMVTIRLVKRGSSQVPTSVPWANISEPISSCPKENVLDIFTKILVSYLRHFQPDFHLFFWPSSLADLLVFLQALKTLIFWNQFACFFTFPHLPFSALAAQLVPSLVLHSGDLHRQWGCLQLLPPWKPNQTKTFLIGEVLKGRGVKHKLVTWLYFYSNELTLASFNWDGCSIMMLHLCISSQNISNFALFLEWCFKQHQLSLVYFSFSDSLRPSSFWLTSDQGWF